MDITNQVLTEGSKWEESTLLFTKAETVTVTISEVYSNPEVSEFEVTNADKFAPKTELPSIQADGTVTLGELFTAINGADVRDEEISVSVMRGTESAAFDLVRKDVWSDSELTIHASGEITVWIYDSAFCTKKSVVLKIADAEKFTAISPVPSVIVDDAIELNKLFAPAADKTFGTITVTVENLTQGTETEDTYTYAEWQEASLVFEKTDRVKVTVKETYSAEAFTEFTVGKAEKFIVSEMRASVSVICLAWQMEQPFVLK